MSGSPRAIAVALFRRGDDILVCPIPDEVKRVTGWRPPGGGIEFGERGEQTVVREMREELGVDVEVVRYLATIENVFVYMGATGHELVRVYEVRFIDREMYERQRIDCIEEVSGPFVCLWRSIGSFDASAPLYPEGLLDLLT